MPSALPPLLVMEEQPLTARDCALGEVIAGKYRIEDVIGSGSMGVVVRATHLGFGEPVALKFIRPEMRKIDGIVSRFAREAKVSVRIRNEHAVNVLDVGVADPIGPFFVMEYLEGGNLEELLDTRGALATAVAVNYVLEACEALAAAHAQGIIHRDIKPQNIFLARQGGLEMIKLLDFGISKAALSGQIFGDDLSTNDQDWVMGTPLYMSPEQLRHAPDLDERTDIWSLGAVLYELLCGQPLFWGDTPAEVSHQVLDSAPAPLGAGLPGVPRALCDVIERCLEPDRVRRFASVAELGQALLPFAPAPARLHVERARALLGFEPLRLSDEFVEDLDLEPLEEGEALDQTFFRRAAHDAAAHDTADRAAVEKAGPERRSPVVAARRGTWIEYAMPVLACAVVWIGVRQCQSTDLASLSASSKEIRTETFALRPADCPLPEAPPVPAPAPAALPEPSPPLPPTVDSTPPTPPTPTQTTRSVSLAAKPPSAAAAARWKEAAWAASRWAKPTHVDPAREALAMDTAQPRGAAQAPLAVNSEPAAKPRPRLVRAKPEPESAPAFRLIEDPPRARFALLPMTGPSGTAIPLVAPDRAEDAR